MLQEVPRMAQRWRHRIGQRFQEVRPRGLRAVDADDLRRVARSRAFTTRVLLIPAAVLWFVALSGLASRSVEYVSPLNIAGDDGDETQLVEQRVRHAVSDAEPTAVPSARPSASTEPPADVNVPGASTPVPAGTSTGQVQGGTWGPFTVKPTSPGAPSPTPGPSQPGATAAPLATPTPSAATPTATAAASTPAPTIAPATPSPSPTGAASPSASPPPVTPAPIVDECSDGADNDGDRLVDLLDPGCLVGLGSREGGLL
jgi:hypothetical protein